MVWPGLWRDLYVGEVAQRSAVAISVFGQARCHPISNAMQEIACLMIVCTFFHRIFGLQTPWNAVKSSRSTSLYWRFIERVPFRRPPLHKPFIGMKLEPGECPEAVRFTFRHFWEAVIGCGTRQFVLARKVHLPWRWLRWQTSDRLSCGYAIQSNTAIQHRPADLWKSWPT